MIEELPVTPRITQDGSYTLYSARVDQCYHSARGAFTESEYVFAQRGLESFVGKREVHLLEVGFGTGLNLLATLLWCQQHDMECHYTGIELYPPSPDLLLSLPSPAGLDSSCLALWRMALRAPWG